jgi:hypothetical protein
MNPLTLGVGLLLILAGGTFALQGFNVLPGSFMTGRPEWAVIGTVGVLAGVVLVAASLRRKTP